MSALKRLHRDEGLITEEECRRFAKLSRERRLHAFSLAVDKHQNEVLRMIDLINCCGLCGIAQRMRGMCLSTSCCIVSNPEHQFHILCMPRHVTCNTMY